MRIASAFAPRGPLVALAPVVGLPRLVALVGPILATALLAASAVAEPVGPPPPVKVRVTPAQQAMAGYARSYGAPPAPQPCQRARTDEVVVCGAVGRGGSPDRLPLPDERGPREVRTATGDVAHVGVGGSPVHNVPATGVTLTMTPGHTRIATNGAQ